MSWISDFDKLKSSTKLILASFVSIFPFFFISVYLFNPSMVDRVQGNPLLNIHFYFLLSVCFVLSFIWFWLVFFLSELALLIWDKLVAEDLCNQEDNDRSPEYSKRYSVKDSFIITMIYSVIYLGLAILINNYWLHWYLKDFLMGCLFFILFRIGHLILIILKHRSSL
jgi:hypothetical protein